MLQACEEYLNGGFPIDSNVYLQEVCGEDTTCRTSKIDELSENCGASLNCDQIDDQMMDSEVAELEGLANDCLGEVGDNLRKE